MRVPADKPDDLIAAAVARLAAGGLVAFPTETVYGLGADAANPAAVGAIFAAKGRPAEHPLIVHIAEVGDLAYWAREVPPAAHVLAARFWPGPLTLIVQRAAHVPAAVTGGQDSVGLRCPAHPLAQALLRACRAAGMFGLAAPSANRHRRISPTTAAHVRAEFGNSLMVLDGGPCAVGIESTIVDLSSGTPRVLRPGMITAAAIDAALGPAQAAPATTADSVPRVPGALAAHYAPHTALVLVLPGALARTLQRARAGGRRVAVLASAASCAALAPATDAVVLRAAPGEPADYARELYASMRDLDAAGVDLILVETPPAAPAWDAIRDRLERAAAGAGQF